MRDAGYHTGALGYNYFLTEHISGDQLPRGFDYYDFQPREPSPLTLAVQTYRVLFPQRFIGLATTYGITAAAQRWVVDNRDRDFAFWMHYYDPHEPYEPPEQFIPLESAGESADGAGAKRAALRTRLYAGEVRFVDANVGQFVQTLKDNDLYDETLIVMTSDHGEEMYEHNNAGHGQSMYQELLRVPFMVKLPKSMQAPGDAGRRVSTRVSMVSLLPTMLDLCGVALRREDIFYPKQGPAIQRGVRSRARARRRRCPLPNPRRHGQGRCLRRGSGVGRVRVRSRARVGRRGGFHSEPAGLSVPSPPLRPTVRGWSGPIVGPPATRTGKPLRP